MSDPSPIGAAARIPNPALQPLQFLIGEWRTEGTHPLVPGKTLPGRTSFAWHEGGAFLIMRSEVHEPKFPSGVAIIGTDEEGRATMIYFDERKVARLIDVSIGEDAVSLRHKGPDMEQTLTITRGDGDTLVSKGRIAEDGGKWADDLSQVFRRA